MPRDTAHHGLTRPEGWRLGKPGPGRAEEASGIPLVESGFPDINRPRLRCFLSPLLSRHREHTTGTTGKCVGVVFSQVPYENGMQIVPPVLPLNKSLSQSAC